MDWVVFDHGKLWLIITIAVVTLILFSNRNKKQAFNKAHYQVKFGEIFDILYKFQFYCLLEKHEKHESRKMRTKIPSSSTRHYFVLALPSPHFVLVSSQWVTALWYEIYSILYTVSYTLLDYKKMGIKRRRCQLWYFL